MHGFGSWVNLSLQSPDSRHDIVKQVLFGFLLVLASAVGSKVYAAPGPLRAPVNTTLSDTLVVVEDLLQRFEETAASHHVLLTGAAAARRSAALRLVRLARYHVVYDETIAWRYLGWAVSFPSPEWYGTVLPVGHYSNVLQAARTTASYCEATCANVARTPSAASASQTSGTKRPYIQPNQIVKNDHGGYDTVLDFIHYPPEEFEVTVRADGQPDIDGKVLPGQTRLQVPSSLGAYEVTARLQQGVTTHRYRAASIVCGREGLQINGVPTKLKMVRLMHIPASEPDGARELIASLQQRGVNIALASSPPPWLLALASDFGLGLAVWREFSSHEQACEHCPAENAIALVQLELAAHMTAYAESPAVWLWVASASGDHREAAIEIAVPAYRQLDPYERPVLSLVDTTLPPAHELGVLTISQDSYTVAELEGPRKKAIENEVALLVDFSDVKATEVDTIWREAVSLGYAGGIVETLDFSTRTPPAP